MNAEELYKEVVRMTSIKTGIDIHTLLTSKLERCVNGRYMIVGVLGDYLTDARIAGLMGLKRQAVNYIRNHLRYRMLRWEFRQMFRELADECNKSANNKQTDNSTDMCQAVPLS